MKRTIADSPKIISAHHYDKVNLYFTIDSYREAENYFLYFKL